jgi:hypothetical protein
VPTGPSGVPPPLHPGVLRIAISYTDGVCNATNVLHFLCHEAGAVTPSDVQSTCASLVNLWAVDLWKVEATTHWHVTTWDAVYAGIEDAPNVKRARGADATAGASSDTNDYANCAFLINWSTGDPRRGGKPRSYLPGVGDASDADSANLQSSYVTNINAGIVSFLAGITGCGHGGLAPDNLIEYSTVLHGAYRATAAIWPIASGTVNPVIGSQRRRVGRVRGG